ncbi:hypothetical protein LR48_Vigan06g053900 [Vigna angularis]|uniref:Phosphomannose isomerase type I catalytic domain-containing protein n=1 Tax=Phaseolus angularis TaxID=3914 RepID=A0A0L9UR44_PHAAN|nr:hypothetical protein LR48_Vigan06g053900 [Vigna angularis]
MEDSPCHLQRLRCSVKNYDWGLPGRVSEVARLHALNSNTPFHTEDPYAELWIGTHDHIQPSHTKPQPSHTTTYSIRKPSGSHGWRLGSNGGAGRTSGGGCLEVEALAGTGAELIQEAIHEGGRRRLVRRPVKGDGASNISVCRR